MKKKTTPLAGLSATLGSLLLAGSAMADVSTATSETVAPSLLDKIQMSYWGAYTGPSVGNPGYHTVDSGDSQALHDGKLTDVQNLDSTLTLGYRLNPNLLLSGNYRFIYQPLTDKIEDHNNLTTKDPWIALKHSRVIHQGAFNMAVDLRFYIPVASAGSLNTAIRSTQISTFAVPGTQFTLGAFTVARANLIREGSGIPNLSLSLSPFANLQLSQKLSATFWSDLLQYDIAFGEDLENKMIPTQFGMNWDVNDRLSLNPFLNVFPQDLQLNTSTLGMYISARFL